MNTILRTSALALALVCPFVQGVQSDFNKKVVIESERQTINMKTNVVTYIGDVMVTQGTMTIQADKLQILNANTEGQQVFIATGQPTLYQQTLESGKLMKAEAKTIRYELTSRVLLLTEEAKLMQEESLVKGDRIRYNLEQQTLEANSKKDGSERVTTIFTPEKPHPTGEQQSPEPAN